MKRHSLLKKLLRNHKGVSGIIASIFLVLIIMVLFFNLFLFIISKNTTYQEAVSEVEQKELERSYEKITISNVNLTVKEDKVFIEGKVTNTGTVSIQLITLWVFDATIQKYNYNNTININLNPGESLILNDSDALIVSLQGASSTHEFTSWFVTARGKIIPIEKKDTVVVAQLSQGIGYISMNFKSFRYYLVENLSKPYYSFEVPAKKETVFAVYLTNLDSQHRDINLTKYSCMWVAIPDSNAMSSWPITKVVNGTLVDFDYQVLEYGKPTLVYFGPKSAASLSGHIAALNILLYGKIGSADYGQNIPFIAIYLS